MRKTPAILSSALLTLSLAIFLYDTYVIHRYGFDFNDVAAITNDGPVDWPTGERPAFTLVPAFVYAFGFWIAALLVFSLWPRIGQEYQGRIYRGTE